MSNFPLGFYRHHVPSSFQKRTLAPIFAYIISDAFLLYLTSPRDGEADNTRLSLKRFWLQRLAKVFVNQWGDNTQRFFSSSSSSFLLRPFHLVTWNCPRNKEVPVFLKVSLYQSLVFFLPSVRPQVKQTTRARWRLPGFFFCVVQRKKEEKEEKCSTGGLVSLCPSYYYTTVGVVVVVDALKQFFCTFSECQVPSDSLTASVVVVDTTCRALCRQYGNKMRRPIFFSWLNMRVTLWCGRTNPKKSLVILSTRSSTIVSAFLIYFLLLFPSSHISCFLLNRKISFPSPNPSWMDIPIFIFFWGGSESNRPLIRVTHP